MRKPNLIKAVVDFCDVSHISEKDMKKFSKLAPIPTGFSFTLLDVNGSLNKESAMVSIYRGTWDITARTMKRIPTSPTKNFIELSKAIASAGLLSQLEKWFSVSSNMISESTYDAWHHETCEMILPTIQAMYTNHDDTPVNYGKAQKVVNMTMKHLYCLQDADKKEQYFTYCHMALDSYILNWFCSTMKNAQSVDKVVFQAGNMPSWSTVCYNKNEYVINQKYTYQFIVDQIRWIFANPSIGENQISEKIKKHPQLMPTDITISDIMQTLTPFQAEFFIWKIYRA